MQTLKNIAAMAIIAAFMLIAPMSHSAEAQVVHHTKHVTSRYVPSTNPYDNGHANVIHKAREKWRNAKQKVRYTTYRISHKAKTSAAERAQDRARERQDRLHEAQDARQR